MDWKDVFIHGAMGAVVGIAAFFLGGWLLFGNAVFWFFREAAQRRQKGQPYSRLFTEPQVVAEWALPIAAAPAVWLTCRAFLQHIH